MFGRRIDFDHLSSTLFGLMTDGEIDGAAYDAEWPSRTWDSMW